MRYLVGIDFDGVIHDSRDNTYLALNQTLREHGLKEITMTALQSEFGRDWHQFFEAIGVPKHLHAAWKAEYQKRYDQFGNGPMIAGTRLFIESLNTLFGKEWCIVTNEHEDRVRAFLLTYDLQDAVHHIEHVHGSKTKSLEELGIRIFVGDSQTDAAACVEAATKPRGILIGHMHSYNSLPVLKEWVQRYPDQLVLASGLPEALLILRNLHDRR